MYSSLAPVLVWIFILTTLGFATWKGAAPERLGVLAIFLAAIVVWAIETFAPSSAETLLLLISDALLAVAFLVLAVRYASLWLGLAMMFQAGQFVLHAVYVTGELTYDLRYAVLNNLVTFGICSVILCGTIIGWRRRRMRALARARSAQRQAAAETPAV
jgi:hypothetical protein